MSWVETGSTLKQHPLKIHMRKEDTTLSKPSQEPRAFIHQRIQLVAHPAMATYRIQEFEQHEL